MRTRFGYSTVDQFKAEAARRMEGFEFTALVVQPTVEVWHCAKPGTGCYHFTITALLNGMTVCGDMDGFLFNVSGLGRNYGIKFLTHPDKRYVAEKLEGQCRLKEFDEPEFLRVVARLVGEALDELLPGFDCPVEVPAWVRDQDDTGCTFEAVATWVRNATNDHNIDAGRRNTLHDLDSEIEQARTIDNAHDAYTFLNESEAFNVDDVSEFRLERFDHEMVQRLYMVEHAAAAILAIKAAQVQSEAVAA